MSKYLIKRVETTSSTPDRGPMPFGLFEVRRSMREPVAVFDHGDEAIAHRVAELLNAHPAP